MAESFSTSSLLGTMDQLWFQQIVFLPEPISPTCPKNINNSTLSASFNSVLPVLDASSSFESLEEKEEEEDADDDVVSCNTSTTTTTKEDDNDDDASNHEDEQEKPAETDDQRRMIMEQNLARLNLIAATARTRSKSLSPSSKRRSKSLNNYTRHLQNPRIYERTTSLRGFHDLELEEVQGFMDLGFEFNKNHITPRIVTLVPGLQRLGSGDDHEEHPNDDQEVLEDDGSEGKNGEEDGNMVMRPYLSEAWRIERPDSPLMRLRMARVSSSSDAMKQHLKLWARTVATHVTTNHD